jgi:hypothetical protein
MMQEDLEYHCLFWSFENMHCSLYLDPYFFIFYSLEYEVFEIKIFYVSRTHH